jgi:hypothetical protein
MDTLYSLCRCADKQFKPPLAPDETRTIVDYKRAYFAAEAKENPLLTEILANGSISAFGLEKKDPTGFLRGPATFFRAHEILRKTQHSNTAISLGAREYTHNEVASFFSRCVPNAKLHHIPWCSLSHYGMSIGLSWGITLLTAHLVARSRESAVPLDGEICFYLGCYSTIAAITYTALTQNRDVRRSAPWNTALYLDLNADLLRRNSPLLALARKEILPRQHFKRRDFYYAIARKIETHRFDAELTSVLSPTAMPSGGLPSVVR